MKSKLILIMVAAILPGSAIAQLNECNGVWTNKPCPEAPAVKMEELAQPERSEQDTEKSQKSLWIHDLDMKATKAKEEHGISIDIGDIRDFCETHNAEDCRGAISDRDMIIERTLLSAKEIEIHEKEVKDKAAALNVPQTVTIIQNIEAPKPSKDEHTDHPGKRHRLTTSK